jgi:hypothetical protein
MISPRPPVLALPMTEKTLSLCKEIQMPQHLSGVDKNIGKMAVKNILHV